MNFCSNCGQPVDLRVPPGDHLPRFVCGACGTIHYQNPRIVAGCVPEYEGRILMCRRAIEPRRGFWTVPGRLHGERRDDAAGRPARVGRGSAGARSRSARCSPSCTCCTRTRCTSCSARSLPRPDVRRRARRASKWCSCDEARDALARHRVPERRVRAAALSSRTVARRRGASFHDDRPARAAPEAEPVLAGRPCFGRIRAAARARSTRCDRDFAELR